MIFKTVCVTPKQCHLQTCMLNSCPKVQSHHSSSTKSSSIKTELLSQLCQPASSNNFIMQRLVIQAQKRDHHTNNSRYIINPFITTNFHLAQHLCDLRLSFWCWEIIKYCKNDEKQNQESIFFLKALKPSLPTDNFETENSQKVPENWMINE